MMLMMVAHSEGGGVGEEIDLLEAYEMDLKDVGCFEDDVE